jgi:membrane-bound ClpP family serine protease
MPIDTKVLKSCAKGVFSVVGLIVGLIGGVILVQACIFELSSYLFESLWAEMLFVIGLYIIVGSTVAIAICYSNKVKGN